MLSTEFYKFFEKHSELYLGCFSADNYPKFFSANYQFFILNKQPSHLPGSHWYAVLLNNNVIEFFDSAGSRERNVLDLLKFKKQYHCDFNETVLQPYDSDLCGEFCIFFVLKRLLDPDLSYKKFLNRYFSPDLVKNNEKVKSFCNRQWPI